MRNHFVREFLFAFSYLSLTIYFLHHLVYTLLVFFGRLLSYELWYSRRHRFSHPVCSTGYLHYLLFRVFFVIYRNVYLVHLSFPKFPIGLYVLVRLPYLQGQGHGCGGRRSARRWGNWSYSFLAAVHLFCLPYMSRSPFFPLLPVVIRFRFPPIL